ncbi:carboxylesterase [Jiulongibacter sediminis]|jgi:pimeloyl-ACP methyl ester carboxylesterase|uniref:alpha/beta hydrolase n=1 Tax=Jiulongibacter sediminis TaxID=1605367 RepID=UPI0026E9745A|nr:alpha/beta fold hydrolase [Jiulongibacter sediminis]
MLKKPFIFVVGTIILALGLTYYFGPRPEKPDLQKEYSFDLPNELGQLESKITQEEQNIDGIKKDNEAEFVWADSIPRVTEYSIVYIHGFSASHEEGAPVHENLAKKYHANLFKARMAEHGTDRGDETMAELTTDRYIETAERALAIGRKIGKKVIIVATSAGGALSLHLASKHDDIEAMVLYSPCIQIYDENATLLDDPWGLKLGQMVQGKPFNDITPANENQPLYWTMHYRLEALVALQNLLTHAMNEETFSKVTCPVFVGYYYKDEESQDKVVSVPAILNMFDQLGSEHKVKKAFPEAENHVLASWVLSKDVEGVQMETEKFLDEIIN